MRQAHKEGNVTELRYHAHAAGDSSQALGATRIFSLCKMLESGGEVGLILALLPKELREFEAAVQTSG